MDEFRRERKLSETTSVSGLKQTWQRWASDHVEYQTKNPFSDTKLPNAEHLDIHSPEYGRPKQGSRTEQRGKDAHTHVGKEVEELCLIIKNIGVRGDEGHTRVTFGKLFEAYVKISNKLVGVLLRGRKHGLLQFDGEMLWQGKDDHVIITLINQ